MSMFNPNFEGGTAGGQHHVGPPTRSTTRKTPGVAKPFTGAPGENRGTDETMGTGIGGTLTNEGAPEPDPSAPAEPKKPEDAFLEPSGTTKVMVGIKEAGEQAVSSAVSSVTEAIEKVNAQIK